MNLKYIIPLLVLFCTAVPGKAAETGPGLQSLHFIVIGDWGMQGHYKQRAVAAQMEALASANPIDFIISTGDNIYPRGVKSSADPLWQKTFEDVYSLPHLHKLPWYVVLGNHDYLGEYHAEIEYGRENPRWILPNNYYDRVMKLNDSMSVQFIFLDTSIFIDKYRARPDVYHHILEHDPAAEVNWLREKLAGRQHRWRIVIGHHTVYSSGYAHGDTEELKAVLPGIFADYDVQAYFSGHDHHLEHNKPPGRTHYFISGGGGEHRWVKKGPDTRFAAASKGFAYVVIDDKCMRVRFINSKGKTLYQTEVPAEQGLECNPAREFTPPAS